MFIKSQKGFSLIESLIAIVIVSIALLGLAHMQALFATQSVDRTLHNCLIDSATGALAQCKTDATTPATISFICEQGITASVTLSVVTGSGRCNPSNDCNTVRATATAMGKTYILNTEICRYN